MLREERAEMERAAWTEKMILRLGIFLACQLLAGFGISAVAMPHFDPEINI